MIKNGILISMVIPVYNVEPYLEQCLETVLCCDLTRCEIILSLGNSTDKSNDICLEYEREHPFIHVLYQSGIGLSNARNCAIDIARGDYLLFLDSDDYVDSVNLDAMIAQIRNQSFTADVIATDFYRLDRQTGRVCPVFQIGADTPVQHGMEFLPAMLRKRQCFWNVWRYIYRRSFLEAHSIRFLENRLSEDIDFTVSVLLSEPKITFIHTPYYIYGVGRGASLMDCPNIKRLTDTVFILRCTVDRLRHSDFRYAPQLIAQFQYEYILNLALAAEIDPKDRTEAITLYQGWQQVLSGSADPAVRCIFQVIKIIGLKPAAYGLHMLKQIRRWTRRHHPFKEGLWNDHHKDTISHQLCRRRQRSA